MQHCVSVYSVLLFYIIVFYFIFLFYFLLCILGISRFTLLLSVSAVKTAVFVLCYLILFFLWLSSGWTLFLFVCYVLVEYFLMMRENHPNKWFLLELFSVFIWDIWLGHRLIDWPAQLWMVKRQHTLTLTWILFNLQYILRFLIFKN